MERKVRVLTFLAASALLLPQLVVTTPSASPAPAASPTSSAATLEAWNKFLLNGTVPFESIAGASDEVIQGMMEEVGLTYVEKALVQTEFPLQLALLHASSSPTSMPTSSPTHAPTLPTPSPSHVPTTSPTQSPSHYPTRAPSTSPPTHAPSAVPTRLPSYAWPTPPTRKTPTTAPTLLWDYNPPSSSSPSRAPSRSPSTNILVSLVGFDAESAVDLLDAGPSLAVGVAPPSPAPSAPTTLPSLSPSSSFTSCFTATNCVSCSFLPGCGWCSGFSYCYFDKHQSLCPSGWKECVSHPAYASPAPSPRPPPTFKLPGSTSSPTVPSPVVSPTITAQPSALPTYAPSAPSAPTSPTHRPTLLPTRLPTAPTTLPPSAPSAPSSFTEWWANWHRVPTAFPTHLPTTSVPTLLPSAAPTAPSSSPSSPTSPFVATPCYSFSAFLVRNRAVDNYCISCSAPGAPAQLLPCNVSSAVQVWDISAKPEWIVGANSSVYTAYNGGLNCLNDHGVCVQCPPINSLSTSLLLKSRGTYERGTTVSPLADSSLCLTLVVATGALKLKPCYSSSDRRQQWTMDPVF